MLIVRCAWGSRSTRSTRCSRSARAAPRLTAVVVLPTPPFWLAIAIVFATRIVPSLTDARHDYHAVDEDRFERGTWRETKQVIIDLLIVAVVLATAWAGFQKGLVQPLLA